MQLHNITILISRSDDFTTSWCLSFLTSFPKMILMSILPQPFHSYGHYDFNSSIISISNTVLSRHNLLSFQLNSSSTSTPRILQPHQNLRPTDSTFSTLNPRVLTCLSAKLKITQSTIIIIPLYTPSTLLPCPHSH